MLVEMGVGVDGYGDYCDGFRCGDDDLLLFISLSRAVIILDVGFTDAGEVISACAGLKKRILNKFVEELPVQRDIPLVLFSVWGKARTK
jgi:hypothetical protein